MPRIPDSELQRLKEEISVQRLVEASGVELKKGGKDFLARCPFHADDTASLVVTPAKNLWHCFGCQIGGGPIDWVIKSRGVSFRHAVELLKADMTTGDAVPSSAAEAAAPAKRSTVRTLPAPVTLSTTVAQRVKAAGIDKRGGCHLWRHTCATLMLEGGAGIRHIQAMLGHADISSTQIYAQVAIRQLQMVHAATHPGAKRRERGQPASGLGGEQMALDVSEVRPDPQNASQALLDALAREADEEGE